MSDPQVMDQRHAESQAVLLDESRAASEQGSSSVVHHAEPARRSGGVLQDAAGFGLNLSFEELSATGLEEAPRQSNNAQWTVVSSGLFFCERCYYKQQVCFFVFFGERSVSFDLRVTRHQRN